MFDSMDVSQRVKQVFCIGDQTTLTGISNVPLPFRSTVGMCNAGSCNGLSATNEQTVKQN